MRKIFFLLILSAFLIKGQNLVPNPSFEDTIACPTNIGQLDRAAFWINPTSTSPDYFNSCNTGIYLANVPYTAFGYQNGKSGVGFAGIYGFNKGAPNGREYV